MPRLLADVLQVGGTALTVNRGLTDVRFHNPVLAGNRIQLTIASLQVTTATARSLASRVPLRRPGSREADKTAFSARISYLDQQIRACCVMKPSNTALLETRPGPNWWPKERPSIFRYLGELQVWVGSRPVEIRGATQRTLMTALLVAGGHPIPVHALTEELWGSAPPCTPGESLR